MMFYGYTHSFQAFTAAFCHHFCSFLFHFWFCVAGCITFFCSSYFVSWLAMYSFFFWYVVNAIQAHKIVENIWISLVFLFKLGFVGCCHSIWHIFLFILSHYDLFIFFPFENCYIIHRRIRNEHPKMNGWIFCRIQSSHRMVIVFYCWRAFKRLVLNISLISNMLQ